MLLQLSPSCVMQVQYAALDAYCLLQLLDVWSAAAPPAQHPLYTAPDTDASEPESQPASSQRRRAPASALAEQLPVYEQDREPLSPASSQGEDCLGQQLAGLRLGSASQLDALSPTADSSAGSAEQDRQSATQAASSMQEQSHGLSTAQHRPVSAESPGFAAAADNQSPGQQQQQQQQQDCNGVAADSWSEQAALHWGCRLEMLNKCALLLWTLACSAR